MSSSTSKNNHAETAKQQRLKYGALSIAAQHLAKNVSKFKNKNNAPLKNRLKIGLNRVKVIDDVVKISLSGGFTAPVEYVPDPEDLMLAMLGRYNVAFWYMLRHGAPANAKSTLFGRVTPLHLAAQRLRPDYVRALLQHPNVHVNAEDTLRRTPLELAIDTYNKIQQIASRVPEAPRIRETFNTLLEYNANVDHRPPWNQSGSLAVAIQHIPSDIVRAMVQKSKDRYVLRKAADKAMQFKRKDVYGYILDRSAEFLPKGEHQELLSEVFRDILYNFRMRHTPHSDDDDIYWSRTLVQHGAADNSKLRNKMLHNASEQKHNAIVKMLLEEGAQGTSAPYARDTLTAMHRAAKYFRRSGGTRDSGAPIMKRLVESGVPVDIRNTKYQKTPLHHAVQEGNIDAARFLLDHGADIGARNYQESTPLHLAVARPRAGGTAAEKSAIVDMLLKRGGIDVHARDSKGRTPANVAKTKKMKEMLKKYIPTSSKQQRRQARN